MTSHSRLYQGATLINPPHLLLHLSVLLYVRIQHHRGNCKAHQERCSNATKKRAVNKHTTKTQTTKSVAEESSLGAGRKLVNVPELLEAILLELTPGELLLAKRVDETSKDAIDTSIIIQRKLFLKPQGAGNDGMVALNPFVLRVLRHRGILPTFTEGRDVTHILVKHHKPGSYGAWYLRDGVNYTRNHYPAVIQAAESMTFYIDKNVNGFFFSPRSDKTSFEKMLITNPPVEIEVWFNQNGDWATEVNGHKITTIGDLLDICDISIRKMTKPWWSER